MSLRDLAVNLLSFADNFTQGQGLQTTVTQKVWTAPQDEYGTVTFGSVSHKAMVDQRQRRVRSSSGQLVMTIASVTFLRPITMGAKDKLVLADGTTGEIVATEGFVDGVTGREMFKQVWLG